MTLFTSLPFRIISNILDHHIFDVKKLKDFYYKFKLDYSKKIWHYKSISIEITEKIPFPKHLIFLEITRDYDINFRLNILKNVNIKKISIFLSSMIKSMDNIHVHSLKFTDSYQNLLFTKNYKIHTLELRGFYDDEIIIPTYLNVYKLIISGSYKTKAIPKLINVSILEFEDCNRIDKIENISTKLHTLIIYGSNTISEIPTNLTLHTLEIYGGNTISQIPKYLKMHTLIIGGYNRIFKISKFLPNMKRLEIFGYNYVNHPVVTYIPFIQIDNVIYLYGKHFKYLGKKSLRNSIHSKYTYDIVLI